MLLGDEIYLMGKGLGAAFATYMATECRSRDGVHPSSVFKGLILESAFTSVEGLFKHRTGGIVPKMFFSDNVWDTIGRLPRCQMKKMLIHGAEDDIIPVSMSRDLLQRCPDAELVIVPFCKHFQLWR